MSFPHLGRIERGEVETPHPALVRRVVSFYRRPMAEVAKASGCSMEEMEPPTNLDAEFARIMLAPGLRPKGFGKEHLDWFGPAQKAFVVALVHNLEEASPV